MLRWKVIGICCASATPGMVDDANAWTSGCYYRESSRGCSVSLSGAEVHCRVFPSELKDRGLCGIEFIVGDDYADLQAARKAVFPSVPW